MSANIIKSFSKKTGKSEKEINQIYKKAKKEASAMGMSDNESYITSILKTMLGMKEAIEDVEDFVAKFIESEQDFDAFYETITAGSLSSGDIPDTLHYVKRPQESEEDEDEEGKEFDIVQADTKTKKDLKKKK